MKRNCLSLLSALLFAPALFAATPEIMPDTVSVTGTAIVTSKPDRVSFNAGVETSAPTVDDAVRANNEKMAALIAALKKSGAKDSELQTSTFVIYPQQVFEPNQKPRITGFQVMNSVTVTRQDPAGAGRLLSAAVAAGANQASGLNFSVADPAAAENRGLALAFENAKARATLLANAAGRALGRAIAIAQGAAPQPPRPMYGRVMAMQAKAEADVPVESGSAENSVTVSVVFELK